MDGAIEEWSAHSDSISPELATYLKKLRKSYVLYGNMVLLPSSAIAYLENDWTGDRGDDEARRRWRVEQMYKAIACHLNLTHIATTKPIPLQHDDLGQQEWNILRSPLSFTPLYGDFGPLTCSDPPTREDFDQAYWVTAKQNGIYQTWAPRWTMFSRGNISEKARLLTLLSVATAVEEGKADGRGCAAVDLYAGIGYFAFSYLKGGVSKLLCWDLNAWSIEGLMRGARANKWDADLVRGGSMDELRDGQGEDVRLLVFNEDNTKASNKVEQMRGSLPPIRHVNCGLLPKSRGSWQTAVEVLDNGYAGWLHVHENFAVAEIEQKAEEARTQIQQVVDEVTVRRHGPPTASRLVTVEHISRLKSYAPGVMHCVLDIHIPRYMPG